MTKFFKHADRLATNADWLALFRVRFFLAFITQHFFYFYFAPTQKHTHTPSQ
jgi:hypothetical protein